MAATTCSTEFLHQNLLRHKEFFRRSGPGTPLIMAEYPDAAFQREQQYVSRLSEPFLHDQAFDLGVQAAQNARSLARLEEKTGGHRCPGVFHNWGTGLTVALFTGGEVIFRETTSYTAGPVLHGPLDPTGLTFDPDNRWVRYMVEFWRGAASQDLDGLVVASHAFRSPLDMAFDLRGQDLFTDLYDAPQAVDELLRFCAESILALQGLLEEQVPMLRTQTGGVWGVAVAPRLLFINGDPTDLISVIMAERFDYPWIARLRQSVGALYFHHHSIGLSRAEPISRIPGLTIQQILQDPNGLRIEDSIDDALIAASLRTPIHLGMNLAQCAQPEALVERLYQGRFILQAVARNVEHARQIVAMVEQGEDS